MLKLIILLNMIDKVLVVGGAGYIGGCVTDSLVSGKIPFTVYDNLTYENHYLKPVEFIYGDVRDKNELLKILPKYSHVIWLAALVGDGACAIKPELTKTINQYPLEFLAKNYNGRIIFTSTCSVYGKNKTPVTELSKTNPLSVYAQTKLEAENYLKNNNCLIFRLGTAFGVSDTYSRIRMDLAVNYMTMNAIKNKKLTVYGGSQYRPFIHVRDIGRIIIDNLNTKPKGIYNLTTSNSNILDLAQIISKATNCSVEVTKQRFEDDRNYNAIIEKALKDKIFTKNTKFTLEYGVEEVKELILSKRIKNADLDLYSNEKFLLEVIRKNANNSF